MKRRGKTNKGSRKISLRTRRGKRKGRKALASQAEKDNTNTFSISIVTLGKVKGGKEEGEDKQPEQEKVMEDAQG